MTLARDMTNIVMSYRYLGEINNRKAITADDKLYDFAKEYIKTFIQASELDEKHLPYEYWASLSIRALKKFMLQVKKQFGNKCPLIVNSTLDRAYSGEIYFKVDKQVDKFIDRNATNFQECFYFTRTIFEMCTEEMTFDQLSGMEIQENVPRLFLEFIYICYDTDIGPISDENILSGSDSLKFAVCQQYFL